jgi:hypothetical protein
MKLPHYFIILIGGAFLAGFSLKETPKENLSQRMQFLTNKPWKVYEVNVSTYTYTDSISTGIEYKFSTSGDCLLSTANGSVTVPWIFDASQDNIILNQGTADEITYKIAVLSNIKFSYKVIYLINGQNTEYSYNLK